MRGVFFDLASLDRGDLDLTALRASLPQWRFYADTPADRRRDHLGDAEVVVSNKVVLDAALLADAPRLRLICVAATGTNNVDLDAAAAHGIAVCNVRGYATASVVQHVFGVLLALLRNLAPYQQAARDGRWQASRHFCLLDYPIQELAGLRLGIIGYGELGQAVAQAARFFDMEVLVAQRPGGTAPASAGRVELEHLLPAVDVLSLHCPLAPNTRGLIGARELARMGASAVLINTARGGIVDEAALVTALRARRLAGAAVDVLAQEPPAAGDPLLAADIPNLILTPHVAWASRSARQRLVAGLVENVRGFLAGALANRVV